MSKPHYRLHYCVSLVHGPLWAVECPRFWRTNWWPTARQALWRVKAGLV